VVVALAAFKLIEKLVEQRKTNGEKASKTEYVKEPELTAEWRKLVMDEIKGLRAWRHDTTSTVTGQGLQIMALSDKLEHLNEHVEGIEKILLASRRK
jgi:predicted Zn-dependent peptidase